MNNFEKKLIESIKELREMAAEASPKGWTIKIGEKRIPPAELEGEPRKAFEEIRGYLKRDNLMPHIRKEYSTNPKDITFKADGTAVVHDDKGKYLKTYKLKHKAV